MPDQHKRFRWPWRMAHAAAGIGLAAVLFGFTPGDQYPQAPYAAAMVGIMAVWWIFEVVPIAVTSLFPLFLMPMWGIAEMTTVGANYGRPIIFLFLGGFILALGLQQSGVHRRIALNNRRDWCLVS